MKLVFLDTSALVKLFVQERGSDWMIESVRSNKAAAIALLDLTRIELHSALQRRERMRSVPAGTMRRAREVLEQYLRSRFSVQAVTEAVLQRGFGLVESHSLRAYDALQLAGAIEAAASRGNPDALFVTADLDLAAAAKAEGLQSLDPATATQPW